MAVSWPMNTSDSMLPAFLVSLSTSYLPAHPVIAAPPAARPRRYPRHCGAACGPTAPLPPSLRPPSRNLFSFINRLANMDTDEKSAIMV
jgi:hypothetical protein